jgi:hypothetical protein
MKPWTTKSIKAAEREAMSKTVAVETLRGKVNRMLGVPVQNLPTGQKQALCSLLEEVLLETGNYKGFQFINMSVARAAEVRPDDPDYYNRRYL